MDRLTVVELESKEIAEFRSRYLVQLLRTHITNDSAQVDFIADEICLALLEKAPIFCTQTSSWKIVNFFEKIGARVKKEIMGYGETKAALFQRKEGWRKVLSAAVGAGLVWVFGGPAAGLLMLGGSGITIAIEDP